MNKKIVIMGLMVMAVVSLYCGAALAGPLDRMNSGPRVNPATDSMLRVPGVVGMRYESAMGVLQSAGLNPRLKVISKFNKDYQGKEGMVISQLPLPGGMAMLGSSVTITYYMPDDAPGNDVDSGTSGGGSWSPSTP